MRLAIIPARGGSKRIPRKNIRHFLGKPIMAYSIEAALEAQVFDAVVVSTDDSEIAAVARHYGAQVPFVRPADISDDHSITADVIAHAIAWFEASGQAVDYACCIYATAPFVTAENLRAAGEKIQSMPLDFVFSATQYGFPIQRAIRLTADQRVVMFQPEHRLTRSQDLPPAYHDAGQFYWGRADAWRTKAPIFGEKSSVIVLPPEEVRDIDTEEDWRMAELLYHLHKGLLV